jgi:hypothetical protein
MSSSEGKSAVTAHWNFVKFHSENPHIYEGLRRQAIRWRNANQRHGSVEFFTNILRWDHGIETQSQTDIFKINNYHKAFYARLLERRNPELQGFFQSRKSIADDPEVAFRDPDIDGMLM